MYYPNMNMNPYQGMRASTNSINWVQGIEGAKAFTLAPKENVILMDSEVNDKFYIKICDDIGRCTLRVFKYQEELEEKPAPADLSEYVKKSEEARQMNQLYQELNQQSPSQAPQQNNFVNGINNLLQSNPSLKSIMNMVKNGANPKQMFFEMAKQKGIDPNTILSQIK